MTESRCATCTGACCYLPRGSLVLAPGDAERLGAEWVAEHAPDGAVRMVDVARETGDAGAVGCPAVRANGCDVYERRPAQCRAFPAEGCALYRADPRKQSGLVMLRVRG